MTISFSTIILATGGLIRTFASIPLVIALGFLGVPNTRITYKSGHSEYFLFKYVKVTHKAEGVVGLDWEVFPHRSKPVYINIAEIESVTELW